mmetsp:Transcript_179/g.421  ORF Transcript_179/g.421 Transcript_179/m.421 type:complete len:251 (-) Transcript_179:54-806(-)
MERKRLVTSRSPLILESKRPRGLIISKTCSSSDTLKAEGVGKRSKNPLMHLSLTCAEDTLLIRMHATSNLHVSWQYLSWSISDPEAAGTTEILLATNSSQSATLALPTSLPHLSSANSFQSATPGWFRASTSFCRPLSVTRKSDIEGGGSRLSKSGISTSVCPCGRAFPGCSSLSSQVDGSSMSFTGVTCAVRLDDRLSVTSPSSASSFLLLFLAVLCADKASSLASSLVRSSWEAREGIPREERRALFL